jgi:hypothetical protein
LLSLPYVYFFESSFLNALRPIQTKNFASPVFPAPPRPGRLRRAASPAAGRAGPSVLSEIDDVISDIIAEASGLAKEMSKIDESRFSFAQIDERIANSLSLREI